MLYIHANLGVFSLGIFDLPPTYGSLRKGEENENDTFSECFVGRLQFSNTPIFLYIVDLITKSSYLYQTNALQIKK